MAARCVIKTRFVIAKETTAFHDRLKVVKG